jgi:hypothetical protein
MDPVPNKLDAERKAKLRRVAVISLVAPTYFIPEARFGKLVDFLHYRIDNTLLGRVNGKRSIPNYESFDEYVMQHMGVPVAG